MYLEFLHDTNVDKCFLCIFILCLFFSSGVLLTFVCNDRMSDTADEMSKTSKGILNEAILFINRTVGVRGICVKPFFY